MDKIKGKERLRDTDRRGDKDGLRTNKDGRGSDSDPLGSASDDGDPKDTPPHQDRRHANIAVAKPNIPLNSPRRYYIRVPGWQF